MKKIFTIKATIRNTRGKGASRRLRNANQVPGIVYGANKLPVNITIDHNYLQQLLSQDGFYTQILELELNEYTEQVILRDIQRHPFKVRILHFDLQRVNTDEKINMIVPLKFIGSEMSPGVKISGGLISHLISDIEIRCLPKYLLEFVEVNLSNLEINQTVHLSDLKLPKEIEIVALSHGEDKPIATIYIPRANANESTDTLSPEVPVIGKDSNDGKDNS